MRAYDLIALDLDGTVLGPDGKVSPATRRAVRRALDSGYRVAFATGRNYYESLPVIEEIGHYDAAVFVGGASVLDTADGGRRLHRQTMRPALAVEVCRAFEALGLPPIVLQDRAATGGGLPVRPAGVPGGRQGLADAHGGGGARRGGPGDRGPRPHAAGQHARPGGAGGRGAGDAGGAVRRARVLSQNQARRAGRGVAGDVRPEREQVGRHRPRRAAARHAAGADRGGGGRLERPSHDPRGGGWAWRWATPARRSRRRPTA